MRMTNSALMEIMNAEPPLSVRRCGDAAIMEWRNGRLMNGEHELEIALPSPMGADFVSTDGVPATSRYEPGSAPAAVTADWLQHIADQQVLTGRGGAVTYDRITTTDANAGRDDADRAGENDFSATAVRSEFRSVASRLPMSEEAIEEPSAMDIASATSIALNMSKVRELLLNGRGQYTTGSGKTERINHEPEGIGTITGTNSQAFEKAGSSNFTPKSSSFLTRILAAIEQTRVVDQTPDLMILDPTMLALLFQRLASTNGWDLATFREMGITIAAGRFGDTSAWAANTEFGCIMDSRFMGVRYKGHGIAKIDSHVNGVSRLNDTDRTELALGYDDTGFSDFTATLRVATRVAPLYYRPGAITMLQAAAS